MNVIYLTGIINAIYFRLVKQEENKKKIGNAQIILLQITSTIRKKIKITFLIILIHFRNNFCNVIIISHDVISLNGFTLKIFFPEVYNYLVELLRDDDAECMEALSALDSRDGE